MLEQMIEAAITMNPDGTILFCNANFGRLAGLPCERILRNLDSEVCAG